MGKRIDALPAGSDITGSEVFPGMIGGTAYSWTTAQIGTYLRDLLSEAPQRILNADGTLILSDAGKHIFHAAEDTTPRTWTIPSNSSVAFAVGDAIAFINEPGAGAITIAINTDTMWLAGSSTTGNRTLAAGGIATAIKVTTTKWVISGAGLT